MLISVRFNHCCGNYAVYHIYDSDFEDEEIHIKKSISINPFYVECVKSIIDVYEKRNLNVAFIISKWLTITCGLHHIEEIKYHLPEYNKYAEDVEKYLMLM